MWNHTLSMQCLYSRCNSISTFLLLVLKTQCISIKLGIYKYKYQHQVPFRFHNRMVRVRFVQVRDFTAWKIHDKLTWVSFLLVLHQCRLLTFYSCPFSLFYRHLPRTHPRKNAQRENILVFFTLKAYQIRHGPTLQLIISDIWQFEEKV